VAGASKLGATIMRTHFSGAYAPASVGGHATYGFIVGRNVDVAAALPNIVSDSELDWMLNTQLFPTTSGATVDASVPFHVDLRSKRKVEEMNSEYLFVWQPTDSGTSSLTGFVRTLLALP